MGHTGSEIHTEWDTHGMEYTRSRIYGVGYTWSVIHTDWDTHGVGYTRSEIQE